MHRFRGTDVGLGLLAIAVNVALVVGVVFVTTGRADEDLPAAAATRRTTASPSPSNTPTPTASPTPTPSASKPEDLFARDAPTTVTVLGDQTGDGQGEWAWAFSELLGRDHQVTLHQLDPQDPTVYDEEVTFGGAGPEVAVYNGSHDDAKADYAARRLPFLSPKKPDLVILNYGRNDSAEKVAARLEKTANAVQSEYDDAMIVVTLQPPTAGDDSKEVRDEVKAWAKKRGLATLDIAAPFLKTGESDAYVSARDASAMSASGDRLWGRTAYRLLVGQDPPEVQTASSAEPSTTVTTDTRGNAVAPTQAPTRGGSSEPTAPAPTTPTTPTTPTDPTISYPTVRPTISVPPRSPATPTPDPTPTVGDQP